VTRNRGQGKGSGDPLQNIRSQCTGHSSSGSNRPALTTGRHGAAWHGMAGGLCKPDSGPDQRQNADCPIIDCRRMVDGAGASPTPAAAAAAGGAAKVKGHLLSRLRSTLGHLEIRRVHPSPEGHEEASNLCNKGSDGMARSRPQVIVAMRYVCAHLRVPFPRLSWRSSRSGIDASRE
jgi:hypothetical protein